MNNEITKAERAEWRAQWWLVRAAEVPRLLDALEASEKEYARLREVVRYADHLDTYEEWTGDDCDCGYDQAKEALND